MTTISVIVPIYNVEQYLPRCLDSILLQTFNDFELILVDDGSLDNCGTICDEYAMKDKRIRVIHQENAKISAARNAGLDVAQGEWIAIVDSDDWIHKDYLSILLSGALEDTDLVICGCQIISNDEEPAKIYSRAAFKSVSLDDVYSDYFARTRSWGRIIRRDAIGELRFISGTEPVDDICFNELLYRRNMKFRVTEAKLYYYYMRPDSAIHQPMGRGIINAVYLLIEHLEKIGDAEKRERIIKRCFKGVFSARYSEMFSKDHATVEKRCRELLKQLTVYLPEINIKDRMVMRLFSLSPATYRVWRILSDPSLLQYERKCKRDRNEHRRQEGNNTAST